MNKFRVNKPVSDVSVDRESELQRFKEGAILREQDLLTTTNDEKPAKSFTIPLNDSELDLLRNAAKKDNRSQRYIARKLLVIALEQYLNET